MEYYNTMESHPIIKKSRDYILNKKLLSVHSGDRDISKWKNSNEFEITLPENIKNVESIKLNSISISNKTPVFSTLFQNNKFQFKFSSGTETKVVELDEGTYTMDQLTTSIENKMNLNDSSGFKCKYNDVTGKLWFGHESKEFNLLFDNKQNYKITNLNTKIMHDKEYKWGLPAFLGYKKETYTSKSSTNNKTFSHETTPWLNISATGSPCNFIDIETGYDVDMVDTSPYDTIYMEIEKYNSLDEISEYSKHNSMNRDKDYNGKVNSAFAKIPLINNHYTLLSKSNSNNASYHSPPIENLSKLKFKFRYHNGLPINLKNIQFSFIIEFSILTNEYHNPSIVRKLF
jgi:hypothetical protein